MIDQPKYVDPKNGIKYTPSQMEEILEDFRSKVLQPEDKLADLVAKYSKEIVSLKPKTLMWRIYMSVHPQDTILPKADQETDIRNLLRKKTTKLPVKIIEANC